MVAAPAPTAAESGSRTLHLVHRGRVLPLSDVPADTTLLALLRQRLGLTGVKEGCAAGDCGACTVAVADLTPQGRLRWRALNSCIRLAHGLDGCAVWTAQDLQADPLLPTHATLHPVQQALLEAHGSQCGFCTPGIVMSLFVLDQLRPPDAPLQRDDVVRALSGNLCRCTGYRPILEAAQTLPRRAAARVDEDRLRGLLQQANEASDAAEPRHGDAAACGYLAPRSLAQLLRARRRWPQAVLVAGGTDACLQLTLQRQRWSQVLDVSRCAELTGIDTVTDEAGRRVLRIGAAATLHEALGALQARWPALQGYWDRFAGQPIRHGGTLGGNVANGSPIGDSMPVLIALQADVVLASEQRPPRRLALEDFYLGYRRTALAADEVLAWIEVPLPQAPLNVAAHKLSKRFEDDISTVSLALAWRLDDTGRVAHVRIAAGGVAPVPCRARMAETALLGQPWGEPAIRAAMAALGQAFDPLSDGRASAAYRRAMLASLLWRTWLEHGGTDGAMPLRLDEPHHWQRLQALCLQERP